MSDMAQSGTQEAKVYGSLNMLEKSIAELNAVVDNLGQRLQPVLAPAGPETTDAMKAAVVPVPQNQGSPIVEVVKCRASEVEQIRYKINRFTDRLEI